jgi:CheY-like chemotaxis protein
MATILIVDDDKDFVAAYSMILAGRGHQVTAAYSAQEARDLLSASPVPDLALLDAMMESSTAGFQLARDIHQQWPGVLMVMLTRIHEATDLPFRFAPDEEFLPVTRFIDKPADPQAVIEQIEALLAARK